MVKRMKPDGTTEIVEEVDEENDDNDSKESSIDSLMADSPGKY